MARRVTYYFSLLSTWSYIGAEAFASLSSRHGLSVDHVAIDLSKTLPETGGVPFSKRHPSRLSHRRVEMRRWMAFRGLPIVLDPPHWPFAFQRADRMVTAAVAAGRDPGPFTRAALRACWAEGADLADAATLIACADRSGLDGAALYEEAGGEAVAARYEADTQAAIKAGIFGAPTYVVDGEIFWGQDRLDALEAMLTEGREAIVEPSR